jgi:hypothetical protein
MVSRREYCIIRGSLLMSLLAILGNSSAAKSTGETSASGSPQPGSDRPSKPRQSVAPQSVIPADADDDTKLAMYREKLKYHALGQNNGTPDDGPAST